MKMSVIEKVIQMLEESSLTEFEWITPEETLKLKKTSTSVVEVPSKIQIPQPQSIPVPKPSNVGIESSPSPKNFTLPCDLYEFTSPMVGSFYTALAPDEPTFVKVGSTVKKGDILCIIEAMKLMNEIESEVDGVIEEICIKDGEPVEFGSILFKIKEK